MAETEKQKVQVPEKQTHSNIFAALAAFQGELKPMEKNGHVEFQTEKGRTIKFDYTPLGEIMSTIYPLLGKHGLSVRHEVSKEGVEAILTHETYKRESIISAETDYKANDETPLGYIAKTERDYVERVEGEIRSGVVKISYGSDMKDTGGAITYARRYTLTMLLGISSEDDKDVELLEQSAKNAIQTVFDRFKAGVEKAKKPEEVQKSMAVLQKDVKALEAGKAPALGLSKEQYEELLNLGQAKIDELETDGPTVEAE